MRKIIIPATAILLLSILFSCRTKYGSGNIVTVQKSVPSFDAVSVSGGIETEISVGPQKIVVEADDNLVKFVKTEVVDGKLKISTGIKSLRDAHIKVFVTAPSIDELSASAGAEIKVNDVLESPDKVHFTSSSAAEIESKVDAPNVEVDASSGAKIKISGRTRNLAVESTSGAEVEAFGLMAETTEARSSSGGQAEVFASVTLSASASSGGEVKYRDGGKASISQSSGGTVSRVN